MTSRPATRSPALSPPSPSLNMAPMLAPLKCGFHFQRRKLAHLLRQTSWFHHRSSSAGDSRTDHRRQSVYLVSERSAWGWGVRRVLDVTGKDRGTPANFEKKLCHGRGGVAVVPSCGCRPHSEETRRHTPLGCDVTSRVCVCVGMVTFFFFFFFFFIASLSHSHYLLSRLPTCRSRVGAAGC